LSIQADQLENNGILTTTAGDILLATRDLKFEGGAAIAAANLRIQADDFKAQMSTIETGVGGFGSLILDVGNRLTDNGGVASNVWRVTDGFQLLRKPTEGDLSGTEMVSFLNRFREGVHVWAAEDLGPTPAGFTNNMALSRLTLDGTQLTLFTFVGPDSVNPYALYVNFLELTNSAAEIDVHLNVATNFTIYFADSNVPDLDGALEGRLRRVSSAPPPAGFNLQIQRVDEASDQAELSWTGLPGRSYRVEFSSSLAGAAWQTLATCEQTDPQPGRLKVCDTSVPPRESRFYRVVEVR
jgi:hypothetical protein